MTDTLLDLNLQITAYVYELHELQGIIKELDQTCQKDPSPENLLYMEEIGDRYLKICNKLRIILEAYFFEENKEGLPTEFSYRKLYKQLTA
jgi:hypothetical protein